MSDDEEETKRIVRSAREKRYEALNNLIHSIRNSKKIKDFNKMETHFVDLCKAYEKAKPVIEKEEKGVTPRFYIRILVELDDLINETWEDKDGRKRMSKNNSKSLGKQLFICQKKVWVVLRNFFSLLGNWSFAFIKAPVFNIGKIEEYPTVPD